MYRFLGSSTRPAWAFFSNPSLIYTSTYDDECLRRGGLSLCAYLTRICMVVAPLCRIHDSMGYQERLVE